MPSKDNCGCLTWAADYYRKDRPTEKWGTELGSSYQEVADKIEAMIKDQSGITYETQLTYNHHSEIFCSTPSCGKFGANDLAKADLKSRGLTLASRLFSLFNDAKAQAKGDPLLPGATFSEYMSELNTSIQHVNQLKPLFDNATGKSLQDLQSAYDELQSEETSFKNYKSNYEGQVQVAKDNQARKKAEEQRENEARANKQQQENLRRQSEAEQKRLDQQRAYNDKGQAINDDYNRNVQRVNDMSNSVKSALTDVQNQLEAKYEREAAADRAAAEERRQEREEQRLREKKEREEQSVREERLYEQERQRAIEAQEYARKKREYETSNVNSWSAKATNILPANLKYSAVTWPNENNNQSLKSLFYVVWNFNKNGAKGIAIKLVEIKKSADGDWPLISDICDRIQSETDFTLLYTPDNVAAGGNVLHYLLGTFSSQAAAIQAQNELKANAINNGYTVKLLDDVSKQKASNTKDFWKE